MTAEQGDTIIAILIDIKHYSILITFLLMLGVGFYLGYKAAYK